MRTSMVDIDEVNQLDQFEIALKQHTNSQVAIQCKARAFEYISNNAHKTVPEDLQNLCFEFYHLKGMVIADHNYDMFMKRIKDENWDYNNIINGDYNELQTGEFHIGSVMKEATDCIIKHIDRGHVYTTLDSNHKYEILLIGYLDLYSSLDCKVKGNKMIDAQNWDQALIHYSNMGKHVGADVENNIFRLEVDQDMECLINAEIKKNV